MLRTLPAAQEAIMPPASRMVNTIWSMQGTADAAPGWALLAQALQELRPGDGAVASAPCCMWSQPAGHFRGPDALQAQERDKLTSAAEGSTRLRIARQEALKLQEQVTLRQNGSKARLQALLSLPGVPISWSSSQQQASSCCPGRLTLPSALFCVLGCAVV